jgi:hypothetical protein
VVKYKEAPHFGVECCRDSNDRVLAVTFDEWPTKADSLRLAIARTFKYRACVFRSVCRRLSDLPADPERSPELAYIGRVKVLLVDETVRIE